MDSKKTMIPALSIIQNFQGSPIEQHAYQLAIEHEDFRSARTFCEQIGILCNFLRNDRINVSYQRIGKLKITKEDQLLAAVHLA